MSVTESRTPTRHHGASARPAPSPTTEPYLPESSAPGQGGDWRPIVDQDDAARFPHACQPETVTPTPQTGARRNRLLGLDVARGIALIGMIAIHTIASDDGNGNMSLPWVLSLGKASALFAVLGGVGIAFITGRQQAPRGALAARMSLVAVVRGLVVVLIGLLLGSLVPGEQAIVVLPYLGAMFIVAALLVPLRARTLFVLGLTWAFVAPVLSHVVRQQLPVQPENAANLTLGSLADPMHVLAVLFFTGGFPVVTWMAYICIGLALGRSNLRSRLNVAMILVGGVVLTLASAVVSQLLLNEFGLGERLADAVAGHMTLDGFTSYLVFGGSGTLPTDSWWWLAVNAPHTGTTLDLLYTIGVSLTVIGACLALTSVFDHGFALLAVPGSMTLTIYSLHAVALAPTSVLTENVSTYVDFWLHVVPLVLFALIWAHFMARGPLEELVARITNAFRPRTASPNLATRGGTLKRDGKVVAPR